MMELVFVAVKTNQFDAYSYTL